MHDSSSTSAAHAVIHGSPGVRARFSGLVRVVWPLLTITLAAGYLLRAAVPFPALTTPAAGFLLLVLVAVAALTVYVTRRRLDSFLKGARGEESVAHELAFLSGDYEIYHGISLAGQELVGHQDLDHVVVGPGAVFVIETKFWTGDISIRDGRVLYEGNPPDRPPLEQVKAAADALQRFFTENLKQAPPIRPVLCFAGDAVNPSVDSAAGVLICHLRELNAAIKACETPELSSRQRAEIQSTLRSLL